MYFWWVFSLFIMFYLNLGALLILAYSYLSALILAYSYLSAQRFIKIEYHEICVDAGAYD